MSATTTGTATTGTTVFDAGTTGTGTNYWALAEEMTIGFLREVGAQPATYQRDFALAISLLVTPAGETAASADEWGNQTAPEGQDFLLRAADLAALLPPRVGDRLTIGTRAFVVSAENGACYEYVTRTSDALLRLHTTRA